MSLNDFIILQKLGSGSFATVYKARRLIDQQIYAIKKIDLKALGQRQKNNALNEIRLLACLKSQYIIGYCDSFFDEKLNLLCIAMQYADGGDLLKKIESYKKQHTLVPQVQVWKIFIHLLYGLSQLHSKNILHRDLKSQNVFIANQTYKIGDMNVSKIVKNGHLAQTQTGTPYYASPQVWNDQPYNQKSDIWSLGCILYQLTSLRPPFEAKNMEKLFDQINQAPSPKIPRNYSKELQSIIDQCLQKNPLKRPSTKDLLLNQTVKIYENMLIQYKPNAQQQNSQPFLKTIYMPFVKRDLKEKLPQSNYKNDRSKELSKENEINEKKTQNQVLSEIQPAFINIENLIKKNSKSKSKDKAKKNQSSKHRNRIQSCQVLKGKQNKHSSSKKDLNERSCLIARAQLIALSQNIPKKKPTDAMNKNKNKDSSKELTLLKSQIKTFQKPILEIFAKNQPEKVQAKQMQLKPRKLIFDETKPQKQKQIKPQTLNKEMEIKQTLMQVDDKNKSQVKNNSILNEKDYGISKGSYLIDTMKNVSGISEKNHSYYNFCLKTDEKQKEQKKAQEKISEKQIEDMKESQQMTQIQQQQIKTEPLQELPLTVNILIDVNENHHKITPLKPKQLNQQQKINIIIGAEKIKNIWKQSIFKLNLLTLNNLKNEAVRNQLKSKENNLKIKFHQQSQKVIKETLVEQKQQKLIDGIETPLKSLQVKRARSKSIPKTERPKQNIISTNQQTNNCLIDKIKAKGLVLQEQAKKLISHEKPKKQIKTEKQAKRIFDQNNYNPYKEMQNLKQKLQQSKQKKHFLHYQNQTEQKPKRHALMGIELSNKINSVHKNEKKIFPNSIFSQGSIQFQSRKKRIFQNGYHLVHEVNDKIDRINLENKIKKYINV